jgi:hypothetical protein
LVETRTIADFASDGPLLTVSLASAASLVGLGYGQVDPWVNAQVKAAEAAQPEGTRIQLEIDSVPNASALIAQINSAFGAGRIVNPADGKPIEPWPGYGQIAFSWNGSNGILLRWVKLQWQIVLVVVLMLVAVAVVYALTRTPYRMTSVSSGPGTGSPSSPPFIGIYQGQPYFFWLPLWVDLPIAAGLAVAPWALRQLAGTIREARDVEQAERGG